jgi:preprotein translocase subunit YajC
MDRAPGDETCERNFCVMTYTFLAEDAPAAAPAPGAGGEPPSNPMNMVVMMLLMVAVFYFILWRPQQKKQKEAARLREEMLKNLTKNDHVLTFGGILGVVSSVTDDEVVLKVDEKNDVRLRVARDHISRVITEEERAGGKKSGDSSESKK